MLSKKLLLIGAGIISIQSSYAMEGARENRETKESTHWTKEVGTLEATLKQAIDREDIETLTSLTGFDTHVTAEDLDLFGYMLALRKLVEDETTFNEIWQTIIALKGENYRITRISEGERVLQYLIRRFYQKEFARRCIATFIQKALPESLNASNESGNCDTALHVALSLINPLSTTSPHYEDLKQIFELLLRYGANPTIRNKGGIMVNQSDFFKQNSESFLLCMAYASTKGNTIIIS